MRTISTKTKLAIIAPLLVVGIALAVRFSAVARHAYYFMLDAIPSLSENTNDTQCFLRNEPLQHDLTLEEIGISFSNQDGNAADDYLALLGGPGAKGMLREQYGNVDEKDMALKEQDMRVFLTLASKRFLSFYPEHYALPSTPFRLFDIELPPFRPDLARVAIENTLRMREAGRDQTARRLLQATVKLGRLLEESPFNTELQWVRGLQTEEVGIQELLKPCERGDDSSTNCGLLKKYATEIAALGHRMKGWESQSTQLLAISGALFDASNYGLTSGAVYRQFGTTKETLTCSLTFLKGSTDPVIQLGSVIPLMLLSHSDAAESLRSEATLVLDKYSTDNNTYVGNLASAALKVSREEIANWWDASPSIK